MNKMSNLRKSLGIGTLVLALAGCQDKAANQTATQTPQDNKPKLEVRVNEFGDVGGSYKDVARYNVTDATRYFSLNGHRLLYWNSPESQTLPNPRQKEAVDLLFDRAEGLVAQGYPAEVVNDYLTLANELGQKNGFNLPEARANQLLTRAVHRQISYELGLAKSRIVVDDFANSAVLHLDIAQKVAGQFGVNLQTSQHRKLYDEVKGLLQTRYNIK